MKDDTRDFWMGATCFVGLLAFVLVVIMGLVWGNRYMRWEHVHPPHSHPHEHEMHEHPHPIPEHDHSHSHPHTHDAEVGRGG